MTDITYTTLAAINVNDHTEKKGTLTYLSWAWAVDQLLRHDPDAAWDYRCWNDQPVCLLHDGTAMVCCTVTVGGRSKTAWLPVMDNKNRAIVGPDAFAINSAMQRALVKAIALCGLGLYIYAGEDLPMEDDAAAAAAQDAYAAWLETLKPIADTGDFQALVDAIKLQPTYAALLRSKDMATWTALKTRQKAAAALISADALLVRLDTLDTQFTTTAAASMAPAEALVDAMSAAGLLVESVTVTPAQTPEQADAAYATGKQKIRDVMKRAGGSMREMPA